MTGCQVRGKAKEVVKIFHLLFADDTLVFCEACKVQMAYLSWLLMRFKVILDLKINLDKSELIPVGEGNDIDDLAFELGCKVGGLPSSYLGLPLGASFESNLWWFGMEWKSGFEKNWPCGRDNISPKGGELPLFEAPCLVCPFTLCSCCASQAG